MGPPDPGCLVFATDQIVVGCQAVGGFFGVMLEATVEMQLRDYVDRGSEAAFTAVVQRCTGLVYATALRRVGGDAHLARDVTQLVFIDLARKARTLSAGTVVAGWLHHHTCFRSATLVRSERRRRAREEKAATMETIARESGDAWERLAPLLDDALESLSRRDRDAIVQRFFVGEDLASMGRSWGLTDDAAQKRVSRSLDKLRRFFARRGVATSSTALVAAMNGPAMSAAPAGLAAAIAPVALLEGAAAGGGLAALTTTLIMGAKIKTAIATSVVVLAATTIVVQQRESRRLRAELAVARAAQTPAAFEPAPARSAAAGASGSTGARHDSAPRLPMFASSEVAAIMARVIREELWEHDQAAFQAILSRIESRDLPVALAYAWENTTGTTRRNLRVMVVEHWAKRDPADVATWCRQWPPSADQQQLNEMVSNIWAATDPVAALQFAPSAEGFRQLALRSPTQAGAEALRLPPGDRRNMAISVIAQTTLAEDPRNAVQWLETLDGEDGANALSAMMPELVAADPLAVAGYVERLAPSDRAVQAARDFAVLWAHQDPSAAAQWSAALPSGSPQRQHAIRGVAEIWMRSDPAPAAAWVSGLSPDATRDAAVATVVETWRQFDPDAARRWVLQTSVSDETRQTLLKRLGPAPAPSRGSSSGR